jgi:HAMP domain-containing protein
VNVILVLMVLGAVLVIAYGFVIGNTIMRPIEEIEEGVLAVINGRTDTRLEVASPELGGLAFRINQLLNVFTGTAESTEDEQGRVSMPPSAADWKDAAFADAAVPAPASKAASSNPDEPIEDPALAARLGAEDEAAYSKRIYDEYVAAKQKLGENVSNIPQDRFLQRLGARGTALAQKHGCRLVRFHVETGNDQVVLRPVLIR